VLLILGVALFAGAGSEIVRAAGVPWWLLLIHSVGIILFMMSSTLNQADRIRKLEASLRSGRAQRAPV